jgi:DnaJ domain
MSPPRTRLDPEGYYARLGLEPDAAREAVTAAFRARVRVLHPDVPGTGDAAAFVAVKQAYDVLSNPKRRQDYDRAAQRAATRMVEPDTVSARPEYPVPPPRPVRPVPPTVPLAPSGGTPWLHNSTLLAAIGLGFAAILGISVVQVVLHVQQKPQVVSAGIRPNAATIAPLSPEAHRAALYGPAPVQLPGTPNFYVIPAATPAVLWRHDPSRNTFVPDRQLPPFSSMQAVRFVRQDSFLEVLVQDQPNGYIDTAHVTPGNAQAAKRAYCSYNAGPPPHDGELLVLSGRGNGRLLLDNRAVQPAVVKLLNPFGYVAISVYLAPGGHADVTGLPEGSYHAQFAVGELWSRACQTFAAGMRARRLDQVLMIDDKTYLEIAADSASLPSTSIGEQIFE